MTGDTVQGLAEELLRRPPGSLCALIAPAGYGKSAVLDAIAAAAADRLIVDPDDVAGLGNALVEGIPVIVDNVSPDRHRPALDALATWAAGPASEASVFIAGRSGHLRGLLPLSDRVRVVDESELALSADAAVDLLLGMAPELPLPDVDTVVSICDGWAAGLTAAGRRAARHPGQCVSLWLEGPGSEELLGRLLADLPDGDRAFLLDTAFLDRLNVSLCDHVRSRTDAAAVLPRLEAHLGFLREVRVSDRDAVSGAWWVRHPILTAALRRMARGVDLTDRHTRAADWFTAAGDLDATMDHLMGAGRLQDAGRVIREHEDSLLSLGRADFAHAWYQRLGPEATDPEALGSAVMHLLRLGWSKALAGDRLGAGLAVEQLRTRIATAGPFGLDPAPGAFGAGVDVLDLKGQVHLLTAYVAMMVGDAREVVTESRRACDAFAGRFERNSHQTAPTLLVRGLLWCGDVEGAHRELARASRQHFVADVLRESVLAGVTALTQVARGEVYRARTNADGAFGWLAGQGLDSLALGHLAAPTALALCKAELGDARAGIEMLGEVADAAAARSMVGDHAYALAARATVEAACGALSNALASVSQARQALLLSAPGTELFVRLNAVEASIRIMGGDLLRAERLVRELPDGNQRSLLGARIWVHRQGTAVTRLLSGIQPMNEREAANLEVLLAAAALPRSTRLAEKHLARAAESAHTHGMLLLLAGASPELVAFAEDTARQRADDRLDELVQCAREARAGGDKEARVPVGAPVPLSRGELALLPLLSTRDSNDQLAQRLGVSVNTVKTRLRRLYRKLGVSSRDEAVSVARTRNLLP